MDHALVRNLLFITLVQLCRAAVTGSWYSANAISDGIYSPKPITDIFTSSGPSFSSANPIVVAPGSSLPALFTYSTPSPLLDNSYSSFPTQSSYVPSSISTTALPPSSVSTVPSYKSSSFSTNTNVPPSSLSTTSSPISQEPSSYSTPSSFPPSSFSTPSSFPSSSFSTPSSFPSSSYSTPSFPPSSLSTQISPGSTPVFFTDKTMPITLSTPSTISYEPDIQPNPQPNIIDFRQPFTFGLPVVEQNQNPQQIPQNPNYFILYQAPQTPDFIPTAPPQPIDPNKISLTTSQTSISTGQPNSSTQRSTVSTVGPPTSTSFTTLSTFQPRPGSKFSSTISTAGPLGTRTPRRLNPAVLCNNGTRNGTQGLPSLRIRMISPKGSITNINILPPTTTRRPKVVSTRKTTTVRPKTRRTKRNRNNYDGCLNGCGGNKSPICATPLSQVEINPNRLKGFPSVCHMACHNSFRRDQYEMLSDGRCGRLRTRIKSADDQKLTRLELNKSKYTVGDNSETVVELSRFRH